MPQASAHAMLRCVSPRAKPRAPRARIVGVFGIARDDCALRNQVAKRMSSAGALQLLGRTNARETPLAHCGLHQAVFSGVVSNHRWDAARRKPIAEKR